MYISKLAIFSFVALATALPGPAPVAEETNLQARTLCILWPSLCGQQQCNCQCSDGWGNYKRDVSEAPEKRTLCLLLPSLCNKGNCNDYCYKKCDDYWNSQKEKCYWAAKDAKEKCYKKCPGGGYKREAEAEAGGYGGPTCKEKCDKDFNDAIWKCDKKYSH